MKRAMVKTTGLLFQLKLEFDNFVISGPSTGTVTVTSRVARSGVVANGGTVPVCDFTRCMTDTFSVTNPGGARPPTICGTNTKEHSEQLSNPNPRQDNDNSRKIQRMRPRSFFAKYLF